MKTLLSDLWTSVALTVVFAVLLCGAYPLLVWGGAQAFFKDKANGSLILDAAGTVNSDIKNNSRRLSAVRERSSPFA